MNMMQPLLIANAYHIPLLEICEAGYANVMCRCLPHYYSPFKNGVI